MSADSLKEKLERLKVIEHPDNPESIERYKRGRNDAIEDALAVLREHQAEAVCPHVITAPDDAEGGGGTSYCGLAVRNGPAPSLSESLVARLTAKLVQIAKLGNGSMYGNSIGNTLAQECLEMIYRHQAEPVRASGQEAEQDAVERPPSDLNAGYEESIDWMLNPGDAKIADGLRDAIAGKGKSTRYIVHDGEVGQVADQPVEFTSVSCEGERCSMCGEPAARKVGEEMFHDDPNPYRHNLTAYVCKPHFDQIMDRGGFLKREAGGRLTIDLAMLCKRLAFRLGRGERKQADKDACKKAMDFLARNNLLGSALRNRIEGGN